MAIKIAKRFFNQNYTSFQNYYHGLLRPTKRAVSVSILYVSFDPTLKVVLSRACSIKHASIVSVL